MSDGYIYVIQPVAGGPVRIGWSVDPERRLRAHQSSSPVDLRLVITRAARRVEEMVIHGRLVRLRLRPNSPTWYPDCPETWAAVNEPAIQGLAA